MSKVQDPFSKAAGVPQIDGELSPKPKSSARVSRKVLVVLGLVVTAVLLLFFSALNAIDEKPNVVQGKKDEPVIKVKATAAQKAGGVGGHDDLEESGSSPATSTGPKPVSLVMAKQKEASKVEGKEEDPSGQAATIPKEGKILKSGGGPGPGAVSPPGPPPSATAGLSGQVPAMGASQIPAGAQVGNTGANAPLTPEEQAKRNAEQERANRQRMARQSGLDARPFTGGDASAAKAPAGAALDMIKAALDPSKQGNPAAAISSQGGKGDSEQESKLDFLKNSGRENHGYHPHIPTVALSEKELKPGHLIPLRLERGINSDLPGMVTARVSEWVYDSVTGCKGLIPPLSQVIGKYDSKVALGQERVLTVWNALVFPDGSELNLAAMQGHDREGMAGMASEVDNHYLRVFGIGLGMSVITAGTQASVPASSQTITGANSAPTFGQQVATGMAQQYGQLGAQLMGKYAAVQPTLRNHPGESFNILVPRTVVFTKVWRDRCAKSSKR